jgi:hypothetical protein
MVRIATLASGFGSAMIKCLLIILTLGPVYLLLLVSAAIIWFMGQLRFFLAVSGTMMLPLFVGMFTLPAGHPSRQSAQAYVMNMVSLALWPVSWAIGHTGTIALYNALISLVAGTSRVPALADALQWAAITSVAPSQAQLQAGEAALGNWFMGNLSGLLSILVGGLGFCLWVLMVSILGPVFLHRVLTAGALFMTQAAASTGRQSAVAGKMAVDLARGPGLGAALGLPAGGARAGEALTGSSAREVVSTASNAWRHLAEGGGASMGGAARSVDVSDGKETGAG